MTIDLRCGDALALMREMPDASVDAVVTDPPYGLRFMGKEWDHGIPGVAFWTEALRIARPGAHLLAFGGTRTFHRLTCAIEDAGWEIRDCLMWLYGSGFPKSHNLDGEHKGWGTALKPAWEPIIMARKPLAGTVAANVAQYGTGAINVDGCRVEFASDSDQEAAFPGGHTTSHGAGSLAGPGAAQDIERSEFAAERNTKGRWPANVVHDGSEEIVERFPETSSGALTAEQQANGGFNGAVNCYGTAARGGNGEYNKSSGSAARFFYCAKASRSERNAGLDGTETRQRDEGRKEGNPGGDNPRNRGVHRIANHHPTVKPVALMQWLCRLVTPPAGVILDPFMGSGTTGIAADREGFSFVGMDLSAEYVTLARRRIAADCPLFNEVQE
jgi:site-specific DNA-methyltransferase (adenine-specific)